jgi:hypothetical protein
MAVSACVWSGVRDLDAQAAPGVTASEGPLHLPGGRTAGLSGAFWRTALGRGGRMPRFERLLVIAPDGTVLGVAEGDDSHVLIPEALVVALTDSSLHATIVHNHPGNGGFSGADLAQLGRAGVDRVIAVGNDGTVFEASAGARFDRDTFATSVYPRVFAQLSGRLEHEAWVERINPAWIAPYLPHFVATVLDQAGIISYRMIASLEQRIQLDQHRTIADVIVRGAARF